MKLSRSLALLLLQLTAAAPAALACGGITPPDYTPNPSLRSGAFGNPHSWDE